MNVCKISSQYIFIGIQADFIINTYSTKYDIMCQEPWNISAYIASNIAG